MRAGLITDTYLDIQELSRTKKSYAELELTEAMEVCACAVRWQPRRHAGSDAARRALEIHEERA